MSEARIHLGYGNIVVKTQEHAIRIMQALDGAKMRVYRDGQTCIAPIEITLETGKEDTPEYVEPEPCSDAASTEEIPL